MRANCCICSDLFDEFQPISTTPCGHVYHTNCLMLWIGQCKTCPICRIQIKHDKVLKLYFNFQTANASPNASLLENEVSSLKADLSAKKLELEECKKQKEDIRAFVKDAEKRASDMKQTVYKYESEMADLRLRLKSAARVESRLARIEQMNSALTSDLQLLNNVQSVVNGTQKDVDNILQECGSSSESSKQMATYCSVLKRELQKMIDSKNKLLELNTKLKHENCRYAARVKSLEAAIENTSKRASISNQSFNSNFSPVPSLSHQPSTSNTQTAAEVDFTSPLSVPFNNLKFNMQIVAPSNTTHNEKCQDKIKRTNISSFAVNRDDDENSVIKTGYNGFGGHSNFINVTGIKKMRPLKRKL